MKAKQALESAAAFLADFRHGADFEISPELDAKLTALQVEINSTLDQIKQSQRLDEISQCRSIIQHLYNQDNWNGISAAQHDAMEEAQLTHVALTGKRFEPTYTCPA